MLIEIAPDFSVRKFVFFSVCSCTAFFFLPTMRSVGFSVDVSQCSAIAMAIRLSSFIPAVCKSTGFPSRRFLTLLSFSLCVKSSCERYFLLFSFLSFIQTIFSSLADIFFFWVEKCSPRSIFSRIFQLFADDTFVDLLIWMFPPFLFFSIFLVTNTETTVTFWANNVSSASTVIYANCGKCRVFG